MFVIPLFFTIDKALLGGDIIKIDHEYSCVWWDEANYLMQHGIRYVFVKQVDNITVWKFIKNELLFRTLADFYSNVYSK